MKKPLRIAAIIAAVLVAVYFMPFITVNVQDSQGRTWRVPFGTSFVQDTGSELSFSSLRSAYALEHDAANALHSYKVSKCYGNTYYYDSANDVSLSEAAAAGVLPTTLTYQYASGNACAGWTDDDEVAWSFGDIKEAGKVTTAEAAEEKGWLVIEDGKALNPAVYNDFSRMVKQGVMCYLRTMIIENGSARFIDVQLLESGRMRVQTWDGSTATDEEYARFSDTEETDGSKPVYVYKGNDKSNGVLLFTVMQ